MINEVIKQILTLDQKTEEAKKTTQEKADEILNNALAEIKANEEKTLAEARESGKSSYDEACVLATEQRDKIKKEADEACAEIRKQFDAVREQEAKRILEDLFQKQE